MDVAIPARHVSISLPVEEVSGVDEVRRFAMTLAEALQFTEPDVDRVARVVMEAATNIVQHAGHGEILLRPIAFEAATSLEVLALDRGPGMANVAHALQDGFSTSGSRGVGLGTMARLSTCFEISSAPGKGTALLSRIGRVAPKRAVEPGPPKRAVEPGPPKRAVEPGPPKRAVEPGPPKRPMEPGLEWGVVCVAKRDEEVCGDAWAVTAGDGRNTVLIVDGLGHGLFAFDAAQQALRAFREHAGERPESSLSALHEALRATRGAVAAIAEIDWGRRELRYAGAGNIAGTLVPVEGKESCLVSHSGTLGERVARFQEFTHPWPAQGLLILHSDGLSSHWELESYPGLTRKDPSLIAGVLYRDFASRRDDVVVLVGRERGEST